MMYARLAAVVIFLAVVAAALWYRGQAISAEAARQATEVRLQDAYRANERQRQTIERITEARQRDDAILLELSENIAKLNEATAQTSAALSELERTNEDVREYMGLAIPSDLRGVLNRP